MLKKRSLTTEALSDYEDLLGAILSAHLCRNCFVLSEGAASLAQAEETLGWVSVGHRGDAHPSFGLTFADRSLKKESPAYFSFVMDLLEGGAANVLNERNLVIGDGSVGICEEGRATTSLAVYATPRTYGGTPERLGEILLSHKDAEQTGESKGHMYLLRALQERLFVREESYNEN